MLVTSTEFQNNVGKYLKLSRKYNIIITKNGKREALLMHINESSGESFASEPADAYIAAANNNPDWVTYSRFVEFTENNEGRFELIDGVVYELASPAFTHQRISKEIHEVFQDYCKQLENCGAFFAPFDIKCVREERQEVPEGDRLEYFTCVVQPDLMILCDYEKDINEKDMYDGTPTLVVEILSPSNRAKDMIKKNELYSQSGIKEFWIVDPITQIVSIYHYKEDGTYEYSVYKEQGIAESFWFPGLRIDLEKLFK